MAGPDAGAGRLGNVQPGGQSPFLAPRESLQALRTSPIVSITPGAHPLQSGVWRRPQEASVTQTEFSGSIAPPIAPGSGTMAAQPPITLAERLNVRSLTAAVGGLQPRPGAAPAPSDRCCRMAGRNGCPTSARPTCTHPPPPPACRPACAPPTRSSRTWGFSRPPSPSPMSPWRATSSSACASRARRTSWCAAAAAKPRGCCGWPSP